MASTRESIGDGASVFVGLLLVVIAAFFNGSWNASFSPHLGWAIGRKRHRRRSSSRKRSNSGSNGNGGDGGGGGGAGSRKHRTTPSSSAPQQQQQEAPTSTAVPADNGESGDSSSNLASSSGNLSKGKGQSGKGSTAGQQPSERTGVGAAAAAAAAATTTTTKHATAETATDYGYGVTNSLRSSNSSGNGGGVDTSQKRRRKFSLYGNDRTPTEGFRGSSQSRFSMLSVDSDGFPSSPVRPKTHRRSSLLVASIAFDIQGLSDSGSDDEEEEGEEVEDEEGGMLMMLYGGKQQSKGPAIPTVDEETSSDALTIASGRKSARFRSPPVLEDEEEEQQQAALSPAPPSRRMPTAAARGQPRNTRFHSVLGNFLRESSRTARSLAMSLSTRASSSEQQPNISRGNRPARPNRGGMADESLRSIRSSGSTRSHRGGRHGRHDAVIDVNFHQAWILFQTYAALINVPVCLFWSGGPDRVGWIFRNTPSTDLVLVCVFSVLWTFGGIGFGVACQVAGVGLGTNLTMGFVMVIGALLPLILNGLVLTPAGGVILSGLAVCCGGLFFAGRSLRTRDLDEIQLYEQEQEKKRHNSSSHIEFQDSGACIVEDDEVKNSVLPGHPKEQLSDKQSSSAAPSQQGQQSSAPPTPPSEDKIAEYSTLQKVLICAVAAVMSSMLQVSKAVHVFS